MRALIRGYLADGRVVGGLGRVSGSMAAKLSRTPAGCRWKGAFKSHSLVKRRSFGRKQQGQPKARGDNQLLIDEAV
jgi:hypothetical protein